MKRQNRIRLSKGISLALTLLLPAVFTACGGDSGAAGESPSTQESSRETTPESTTDAPEPGDISSDPLTVLTYDSFVSEWGAGPQIQALFEESTGNKVQLVSYGDAGQLLARVIREKDAPQGDVVLGLDNNQQPTLLKHDVLLRDSRAQKIMDRQQVSEEHRFDAQTGLVPYDYGFFSIIYDSREISRPPRSLKDLTDPRFAESLILMDPRTSTPGLGFLYWTIDRFGEDWRDYWQGLQPSILTITDGWDSGYGLFTSGEAPLVLSYTSSPAYHREYEETDRYRAALFPEGHYRQLEGMGIIKGTSREEAAWEFLEFMLSREVQEILPLTNWMYPVREDAELPDSYQLAPQPDKTRELAPAAIRDNRREWLDGWTRQAIE